MLTYERWRERKLFPDNKIIRNMYQNYQHQEQLKEMGVFTKRLMWDPTIEGRNIKHTFDKFSGKFGERMAIYCNVAKRYSKLMVAILHDINEGKLSPDEGADRYKEVLDKEQTDKVKKRAVGHYKASETRRRNAETKLIPKVGSAAERDREAMLESNSIMPETTIEVNKEINSKSAYDSRVQNSYLTNTSLNKAAEKPEGGDNMSSCLSSPLMLMQYFMRYRPYWNEKKQYGGNGWNRYYKKYGRISINKPTADMAEELLVSKNVIYGWLKKMENEKLIYKEKINNRKVITIGYIEGNKEIYFYELLFSKRILPELHEKVNL